MEKLFNLLKTKQKKNEFSVYKLKDKFNLFF